MFRSRSWFGGGLWKPKNPHSLEHLKYLYNVLSKNQVVSENNRGLLVETLRSIAEILIWGDQNDSSVFDFFLEKNMLSFFLKIMKQKCGSYVCVQLLQTLNILFENIRNETSLYYLLSNNHVNSIIVHKFDFSDEEVMAYYISFLKTLSLKLNAHTIHFFYNEVGNRSSSREGCGGTRLGTWDTGSRSNQNTYPCVSHRCSGLSVMPLLCWQHTNDFPLYTEAIQFFNHPESMVRIAVRTLTLNVYRVEDRSMLQFIRDKTAAPYFSNLVWFIGNHVLELDSCVRNDADHQSQNRLSDLVAEHLDHLHYLNDILCLDISDLNQVLTDHLLNKLLIPLYVYSLTKRRRDSQLEDAKPHVSSVVSLFLLSQVFLIITHEPLVRVLARIILTGNMDIFSQGTSDKTVSVSPQTQRVTVGLTPGFMAPTESLEKSLETSTATPQSAVREGTTPQASSCAVPVPEGAQSDTPNSDPSEGVNINITDEEKEKLLALETATSPSADSPAPSTPSVVAVPPSEPPTSRQSLVDKPFLEMVFNTLQCSENDYAALFALCLLYALGNNKGVNEELLDTVLFPSERQETKHWYNVLLVEKLIKIISYSCQSSELLISSTTPARAISAFSQDTLILVFHCAWPFVAPRQRDTDNMFPSSDSRIRLVTLELSIRLLTQLVMKNSQSFLHDCHLAAIEGAKEESTALLRNFYKVRDRDLVRTPFWWRVTSISLYALHLIITVTFAICYSTARMELSSSSSFDISRLCRSSVTSSFIPVDLSKLLPQPCVSSLPLYLPRHSAPGPSILSVVFYPSLCSLFCPPPFSSHDLTTLLNSHKQSISSSKPHRGPLVGVEPNPLFVKAASEGNVLCHGGQSEEIFLDMFEDEYNELVKKPLNVEWLMMDHNILLPPTGTPMTGIHFNKRLACGEVERARRAIRVFFLVRQLSLTLRGEEEGQLPLTNPQACVQVDNVLDLSEYTIMHTTAHPVQFTWPC
uniref:Protein CLEC16A n=1 Tax=Timema shepardi TaxID=629360 RepID=A0A7R9AV84_TIMSH|nr:unnamed protein product [Timema shepardi]